MSQENVEKVRRVWQIWSEGVEANDPRSIDAPWTNWRIELEEATQVDDLRVIAKLRQSGVGRRSGAAVSTHFYSVHEFRHGQVVARRDYPELDQVLEAEGLEELPG